MSINQKETVEEYDYIICGGGTAGCVIAHRLASEANVKVLLIEAGEHNEKIEATQMPGGTPKVLDTPADWNMVTKPRPASNNREIRVSRGKFLGGSSGCNGTLCIRGCKQDYDDWGVEGWSGDEMFEYMSKAETFHGKPWFKADEKSHGSCGPLHIEPHDLAPVSELMMQSFESQGLPHDPDMFSTGRTPHGCGHAPRTVWKGARSTGADFITKNDLCQNVTVKTNTFVNKVIIEKENETLRATGVELVSTNGTKSTSKARQEVIISAGTYGSPAILLRSGIGAKDEVEKFGINSQVDLPGVGKNLMDHLIVFMFYETDKPDVTTDHMIYHNNAESKAYELWKTQKTGFLSSFPFGAFAYARLGDRLASSPLWDTAPRLPGRDPMNLTPLQPNVEFFMTECYGGPVYLNNKPPIENNHVFSIIAELFSPRSRGTVTLKSADPLENPVIDHNYLDDPLDLLVLSEACKMGNEIVMQGTGTKDIVKGSWPRDLTHHTFKNREEEWVPYVKEYATTCYHPAGTCTMGKDDDSLAVVDKELRVRGVSNLRVADASIMPTLHGGHLQMPTYGIAEKAADMIKASRKTQGRGIFSYVDGLSTLLSKVGVTS